MVDQSMKVPARVWRDSLRAVFAYSSGEGLRTIRVPTLIMAGEHDDIGTPDEQRRLAEQIPRSRLIVYPGVGHTPQWEDPERFVDDVVAFVRAAPSSY